jgi:hypothetical protein
MSGQCCVSAALHLEKRPGSDSTGGWVGIGTGLEGCGKLCHHQGSNPGMSSWVTVLNKLSQMPLTLFSFLFIAVEFNNLQYLCELKITDCFVNISLALSVYECLLIRLIRVGSWLCTVWTNLWCRCSYAGKNGVNIDMTEWRYFKWIELAQDRSWSFTWVIPWWSFEF